MSSSSTYLLISLADEDLRRLNLAATAPYDIVKRTDRDASKAPKKLATILLDMIVNKRVAVNWKRERN